MNWDALLTGAGKTASSLDPHIANVAEIDARLKDMHDRLRTHIRRGYRPFAQDPIDFDRAVAQAQVANAGARPAKMQKTARALQGSGPASMPSRQPAIADARPISPVDLVAAGQAPAPVALDPLAVKRAQTLAAAALIHNLRKANGLPLTAADRARSASVPVPADIARMELAANIMRGDTGDMSNRGNLQRYGSTPTASDVDRLKTGVPLPAQQWGFPDRPAINPAAFALASALQTRFRNHPGRMIPNLAPAMTPDGAALAEWQNKPGRNTLTPQQFLDTENTGIVSNEFEKRKEALQALADNPQRQEYLRNRADKLDERQRRLALNIEAKRRLRNGEGANGESLPLVNIDPSLALWNPTAFNAAVDWNRHVSATAAQGKESKAERQSKEKMFTTDQDRRTQEATAERSQRDMQFKLQMAALENERNQAAQRHAEAIQRGDTAEAQRIREHALNLGVQQQHLAETKRANDLEELKVKLANNGVLRPDQVGALTPEQAAWMKQHTPWLLPPNPAAGAATNGSTAGKPLPTGQTPEQRGDTITKAINDNRRNPNAAYEAMLDAGIPHEEALAAVRERHPYPGVKNFDPEVGRRSMSSLAESTGRRPGFFTWLGDVGNPYVPDVLLPRYIEDRTRGIPTVPQFWQP